MPKKKRTSKSAGGATLLPDFLVDTFMGLDTATKNTDDLEAGTSPDELNWVVGAAQDPTSGKYFGDHISLRGGYALLGQTRDNTSPFVSGLGVGITQNGVQIPVFSAGQHIRYYSSTSQDVVEVGTNVLPAAAVSDNVSIVPYSDLANYSVLISSANSSIYKIILANPGNIIDFQQNNYRGTITSGGSNRLFLWGRKGVISGTDFLNLYLSYVDQTTIYNNTSGTPTPYFLSSGITKNSTDGGTKTFTGILGPNTLSQNTTNILLPQIAAPIATPVAITNIVAGSGVLAGTAIITTGSAHGFVQTDILTITGVVGMTQINNLICTPIPGTIGTTTLAVNINTTTFSGYSSGGTIAKSESFIDDMNGNLISNLGGTGTINYVTGAYSVTFNTAPVNSYTLVAAWYEENDLNTGILDFTVPASRTTGTADYFSQPGMGNLMNVLGLSNIYFCFHQFGTMQLQIPADDTQSTNLLYRSNVGIPSTRAAYPTGDGIPYLDTLNSAQPKLRLLSVQQGVSVLDPAIVPTSLSDKLDLSQNAFQYAAVYQYGDYYILECQAITNGVPDTTNDIMYIYNTTTGFFDKLDYRARCFALYLGSLIAGDSGSGNVYTLFSGFDDDGYTIQNYWKSAPSFLGTPGTKRVDKLVVKGLITPSQNFTISLSYDNGPFVPLATILGNGQYVALGSPIEVGGVTVGSNVVGGGGSVTAYPFEAELMIGSDFFNRVAIQFQATNIGYVEVDSYEFKNIRYKSRHILAANMQ